MKNRNSGARRLVLARRMVTAFGTSAAMGLLLSGCSSSAPASSAPEIAAIKKTELHFSLDQCERLSDANLYKCPAVDKPICNPNYNGQLECVRVGGDGSIYVQKAID